MDYRNRRLRTRNHELQCFHRCGSASKHKGIGRHFKEQAGQLTLHNTPQPTRANTACSVVVTAKATNTAIDAPGSATLRAACIAQHAHFTEATAAKVV